LNCNPGCCSWHTLFASPCLSFLLVCCCSKFLPPPLPLILLFGIPLLAPRPPLSSCVRQHQPLLLSAAATSPLHAPSPAPLYPPPPTPPPPPLWPLHLCHYARPSCRCPFTFHSGSQVPHLCLETLRKMCNIIDYAW